jgi:hypothetical protein
MTTKFSDRHGGPYDRGSADAYYGRPFRPHYYTGAAYQSTEVTEDQMTEDEREAYGCGYTETSGPDFYIKETI